MRFVGLKQLPFIVSEIGYANAVELFVVPIKMTENMAKRKSRKTRPLELDHPSHCQAVERHEASGVLSKTKNAHDHEEVE